VSRSECRHLLLSAADTTWLADDCHSQVSDEVIRNLVIQLECFSMFLKHQHWVVLTDCECGCVGVCGWVCVCGCVCVYVGVVARVGQV